VALESALARPRSGYYSNQIQEAAALWDSLSQKPAFVDGNKSVGLTMTAAFLEGNGYRMEFNDLDAYLFLLEIYETGRMRFEERHRFGSSLRERLTTGSDGRCRLHCRHPSCVQPDIRQLVAD
jgi:prophage maintenance system killer protein